jgi:hypothetical protein
MLDCILLGEKFYKILQKELAVVFYAQNTEFLKKGFFNTKSRNGTEILLEMERNVDFSARKEKVMCR